MSKYIKEEVVFLSVSDCDALVMFFEWEEDDMVRGHSDYIYDRLETYITECDEDESEYDIDEIKDFLNDIADLECTCIIER